MKKDKRELKWLYSELPKLVSEDVLAAETAEALKEYYGEIKHTDSSKIAVILFSVMGTLLIGGGIVLIVAHNWSEIPRGIRITLGFLPLIFAQVGGVYVLIKKNDNTAMKEGIATFLMLTFFSAMALVSQAYHLSDSMDTFLFTGLLVSLLLVYIFNSATIAIVYLIGITFLSASGSSVCSQPFYYLLYYSFVLPYIITHFIKNRYSLRAILIQWVTAVTFPIGVIISSMQSHAASEEDVIFFLVFIFTLFYLIDRLSEDKSYRMFFSRPLYFIGVLGISIWSIVLSGTWAWSGLFRYYDSMFFHGNVFKIMHLMSILIVLGLYGYIIAKKRFELLYFASFPLLLFICILLNSKILGILIFNLYLITLGIATIISGVKNNLLVKINSGMFLFSVAVLLHFFSNDMNILLRGIIFIVIGIMFLVINYVMLRRKKMHKVALQEID